ncbi:MAG: ABC transporter substrate-binding protein [Oscillospiraceae bacterium]|jgi:peptide/nickel transport system substrate-binding protein|nr:ABC transporter substrate-binding protein [Oscillospiraceae bacterium]
MKRTLISLILFICVLLTGCANIPALAPPSSAPEVTEEPEAQVTSVPVEVSGQKNVNLNPLFTVRWDSGAAMNPISSKGENNLLLSGLMYEGLFRVNPDYTWEPVLCDTWSTSDGINWSFRVKSGIAAHDGSEIGLFDVIGSINAARSDGRFASRLGIINKVGAKDGGVTISLTRVDYEFPALLDVPIMKDGSIYRSAPVGSGPYVYNAEGGYLELFTEHRDAAEMPVDRVYLADVKRDSLIPSFDSGFIDMVIENRGDIGAPEYNSGAERRPYLVPTLHFIGFNSWRSFGSELARRRAVMLVLNRESLIDAEFPDYEPAYTALPKECPYYDANVAASVKELSRQTAVNTLLDAGIGDYDGDGLLEYLSADNHAQDFTLSFIVHRGNLKKVNAAKNVAAQLRDLGFDINFIELSWEDFTARLNAGNYDLFYGSIELTADWSMLPLLDDRGAARYGGYDSHLDVLATDFLASQPGEEKASAASLLLSGIAENVPFAPLVFERAALISGRGTVSGANPTSRDPFYGFKDWEIAN